MKFRLPKIYPITDEHLSGLSHSAQVSSLAAAGATMIQLREKHAAPGEFYRMADEVMQNLPRGILVIVNDRVDIALAVGAGGVHVGQGDLPPAQARELLGQGRIIGYSTHSVEQAAAAVAEPVDYIAAGPVFVTSTKEDPDAVIGLDGLREIRRVIGDFPLVAIGGITATNIARVFDAGADSAAVISSIFSPGRSIPDNFSDLCRAASNDCQQS